MNLFAKSFILVNMLLSVVVCTFSVIQFANRQHYIKKWQDCDKLRIEETTALKDTIDKRDDEIRIKQASIDKLTADKQTLVGDKEKLSSDYQTSQETISEQKKDLDMKSANISKLTDDLNKYNEELTNTRNQLEKAREVARGSRENLVDLQEQVVEFEKETSSLKAQLNVAEEERGKVEKRLAESEWTLDKLQESGIDIKTVVARRGEPNQPVHGRVLSVRPNVSIVILSVGKQDQVKEGYRFTIYRGGEYIGRVQVESVYDDMCSARIMSELLAKDKMIMEGDNASTRVY